MVDVGGEVDLFTAPRLREQILKLIETGRHNIVVDLTSVGFMDSTGLGSLVGALKRVKERDGALVLVGTNRAVHRVLSITGLSEIFPMYDTVEDALKSI